MELKDLLEGDTIDLYKIVDNLKTKEDLDDYIYTLKHKSFNEYFNEYVAQYDLDFPTIILRSNISKGYFYNIINGDRRPSRDKIICLCIGAGKNVKQLNRGLRIGIEGKLDPKNVRDVLIWYAVNKGIDSVVLINLMLEEYGQDVLE